MKREEKEKREKCYFSREFLCMLCELRVFFRFANIDISQLCYCFCCFAALFISCHFSSCNLHTRWWRLEKWNTGKFALSLFRTLTNMKWITRNVQYAQQKTCNKMTAFCITIALCICMWNIYISSFFYSDCMKFSYRWTRCCPICVHSTSSRLSTNSSLAYFARVFGYRIFVFLCKNMYTFWNCRLPLALFKWAPTEQKTHRKAFKTRVHFRRAHTKSLFSCFSIYNIFFLTQAFSLSHFPQWYNSLLCFLFAVVGLSFLLLLGTQQEPLTPVKNGSVAVSSHFMYVCALHRHISLQIYMLFVLNAHQTLMMIDR